MELLLLIPPLLLIFIVFILPLLRYTFLSTYAISVSTGLEAIPNNYANWERLLNDARFWQDVYQTARFAIFSVSIELIIAILIALLLNQNFKGRGLIRAITLIPWALPTALMALGWRWIFNSPYGPINQFLNLLNLPNYNLLSNPDVAWFTTVIADVWKTTPFIAIILLAGLQTIPRDLYEAFYLEGGKPIQSFFRITLPLLKPYILLALIFRTAQAFGVFDLVQILTSGGPAGSTESLALYAYQNAMRFLDFGYSSTIVIASFVLLLLFITITFLLISNSKKIMRPLIK